MDITAAVATETGAPFALETIAMDGPAPDEVLVQIVGVGLCHTDIAARDGQLPFPLPAVFGHEGSGIVTAVGNAVTSFGEGDSVVISFNSCGQCPQCAAGMPSYCQDFMARNFGGVRADGSSALSRNGTTLSSNFFGQSSFASHALANERNVVKVSDDDPLSILGPLGCGVQTGAGAVLNSLDCAPGKTLLVLGGGSVGLSAVLAGVTRELENIVVVEPHAARRSLALSLGATHAIDPAAGPLGEQIRGLVPRGANYAIDTTGRVPVIEQAVPGLAHKAKLGLIGVPSDLTAALPVGLVPAQVIGLTVTGICEGDSDPATFIPQLLDLHRAGRFPFDKLITTMPFTSINEAVEAQHRGDAVKVVLVHDALAGS